MVDWTLRGAGRGPRGEVAGWVQDGRPAFWYPESGGYALSHFSFLHALARRTGPTEYLEHAHAVARWLEGCHVRGGYGRDGRLYPFDAGIVLKGFLHYLAVHPDAAPRYRPFLRTVRDFILNCLRESLPCVPVPGRAEGREARWSQRIGPHLIKTAACLRLYGVREGDSEAVAAARAAVAEVLRTWTEGWLWAPGDAALYVHAQCYALEGLLMLGPAAPAAAPDWVRSALAVLARAQDAGGGVPSHVFSEPYRVRSAFPSRSDATAQCLRLWLLDGDPRWRTPVRRARAFLRRSARPSGAMLYESGLPDENLWATFFAVQAFRWADARPDPAWLL
jgi:hypothetical protein